MANGPLVSAIVVSYDTRELTLQAVGSLFRFLPQSSDVWVVDNGSADGSPEALRSRYPDANVIRLSENIGFGRANNQAMRRASGRYLLLLNSDAQLLDAATVRRLVAHMNENPKLAAVGPRLENPEGALEHSARSFPSLPKEIVRRWGLYLLVPRATVGRWLLGDFWAPSRAMRVDWITGACMLVRREAYEAVGGFDERILMYGEEQEWAWRLKQDGWDILYEPSVSVRHRRAASGAPGAWRVRAALDSDVRIFRWTHGRAGALALNIIRLVGFLLEAGTARAAATLRPSNYMQRRAAQAWQAFRQQLHVAARRPCG